MIALIRMVWLETIVLDLPHKFKITQSLRAKVPFMLDAYMGVPSISMKGSLFQWCVVENFPQEKKKSKMGDFAVLYFGGKNINFICSLVTMSGCETQL